MKKTYLVYDVDGMFEIFFELDDGYSVFGGDEKNVCLKSLEDGPLFSLWNELSIW